MYSPILLFFLFFSRSMEGDKGVFTLSGIEHAIPCSQNALNEEARYLTNSTIPPTVLFFFLVGPGGVEDCGFFDPRKSLT